MGLTQISQPITGTDGFYENVFPSRGKCEFKFNRKDLTITAISSGTDNKVRMVSSADFEDIEVGQFVTWQTAAYELISSRVLVIVDTDTIEVDHSFSSTNVTGGWVNYKVRWYLEARFVLSNSVTDDQDALLALNQTLQVTNAKNGDAIINCGLIADKIIPTLDLLSVEQISFQTEFKIQYRESWEGNRSENWISPTPDVPVLFIHASREIPSDDFIDSSNYTYKFWKGYPLFFSYIHSKVNDLVVNTVKINANQYSLGKSLIESDEVMSEINFNGLAIGKIETSENNVNTAFIRFSQFITSNKYQYDPTQYDPTQYA